MIGKDEQRVRKLPGAWVFVQGKIKRSQIMDYSRRATVIWSKETNRRPLCKLFGPFAQRSLIHKARVYHKFRLRRRPLYSAAKPPKCAEISALRFIVKFFAPREE